MGKRRSKTELYVHVVWATWQRQPLVVLEIQEAVYRCIGQVTALGGKILAVGGMLDHVHLLAQVPGKVSVAQLAQQVKGVSSTLVRNRLRVGELFRWQEHYAAFSVSRSHLVRVIRYINNQERHHSENTAWDEWEQTDEEADEQGDTTSEIPVREDG